MGWASYQENILEKITSALQQLSRDVERIAQPQGRRVPPASDRLDRIAAARDQIESSLKQLLELATDPNIKLAADVSDLNVRLTKALELNKEVTRSLEQERETSRSAMERLDQTQRNLDRARNEARLLCEKVDTETQKNKQLQTALTHALTRQASMGDTLQTKEKRVAELEAENDRLHWELEKSRLSVRVFGE